MNLGIKNLKKKRKMKWINDFIEKENVKDN